SPGSPATKIASEHAVAAPRLVMFVRLDPPGQWCTHQAVCDAIARCGGTRFLEVGCGVGRLSRILCERGLTGRGVDVSAAAIAEARIELREFIDTGQFDVRCADALDLVDGSGSYDLALSI